MARIRLSPVLAIAVEILISAFARAAYAQVPLFSGDKGVSVLAEPTLNVDVSDIQVYCSIWGASLYIDKDYVGKIPYTGSISPGNHYFELELPGYYGLQTWVMLEEKTKYTISFRPTRITGYLSIEVEPTDASISVDGKPAESGQVELPIGPHALTAKRFGFIEQDLTVTIAEHATSLASLQLERAPFAISGLAFSRKAFNPRNAGASGSTSLSFHASSYGSAKAEIRGPGGARVDSLDFPNIDAWSQSREWNGLGPDGTFLPDGEYTVLLTAWPAADVSAPREEPGKTGQELGPDASIVARTKVRIDSSLVIRPFGPASVRPGLLYSPDPAPQPAGTVAMDASWFSPWGEPQSSAAGLSAAFTLGSKVTLAIDAAAEAGPPSASGGPDNSADVAISALVSIFGDDARLFDGALFFKGGYSSASAPAMPGARTAVEASLALSTRLSQFAFALAPGLLVNLASGSQEALGLVRAGLWLEGRSFKAGVSGEIPISFSGGPGALLLPAQAALEGSLMLGSTPLVGAASVGAAFEPGTAPAFEIGLGLGLLF